MTRNGWKWDIVTVLVIGALIAWVAFGGGWTWDEGIRSF